MREQWRVRAPDPRLIGAGILYTWAEIAAYLRVPPRTAQRWHEARPMPLSRYGRCIGCSVRALDGWFDARGVGDAARDATARARAGRGSASGSEPPRIPPIEGNPLHTQPVA